MKTPLKHNLPKDMLTAKALEPHSITNPYSFRRGPDAPSKILQYFSLVDYGSNVAAAGKVPRAALVDPSSKK